MIQSPKTTTIQTKRSGIPLSRLALLLLLVPLAALLVFPSLGRASVSAAAAPGDADRGKALFEKRCTGCHSLDQDKEGPHLRNVYGRKAGKAPNFPYSTALKSAQITWDDASLERWLTNPDAVVPDTDMAFHVPKPEERADIIRFLRVASGK